MYIYIHKLMAWDIQDYNVAEQLQKFADVFAPGGL